MSRLVRFTLQCLCALDACVLLGAESPADMAKRHEQEKSNYHREVSNMAKHHTAQLNAHAKVRETLNNTYNVQSSAMTRKLQNISNTHSNQIIRFNSQLDRLKNSHSNQLRSFESELNQIRNRNLYKPDPRAQAKKDQDIQNKEALRQPLLDRQASQLRDKESERQALLDRQAAELRDARQEQKHLVEKLASDRAEWEKRGNTMRVRHPEEKQNKKEDWDTLLARHSVEKGEASVKVASSDDPIILNGKPVHRIGKAVTKVNGESIPKGATGFIIENGKVIFDYSATEDSQGWIYKRKPVFLNPTVNNKEVSDDKLYSQIRKLINGENDPELHLNFEGRLFRGNDPVGLRFYYQVGDEEFNAFPDEDQKSLTEELLTIAKRVLGLPERITSSPACQALELTKAKHNQFRLHFKPSITLTLSSLSRVHCNGTMLAIIGGGIRTEALTLPKGGATNRTLSNLSDLGSLEPGSLLLIQGKNLILVRKSLRGGFSQLAFSNKSVLLWSQSVKEYITECALDGSHCGPAVYVAPPKAAGLFAGDR